MRFTRKPPPQATKKAKKPEPMAEGIVALDSRGRRWSDLSDEELVGYAKRFMNENGLRTKSSLQQADGGLYATLWNRGLLGAVGFDKKKRHWKAMGDGELVQHAKSLIIERGIGGKTALKNANFGLYKALMERELFPALGFKDKHKSWRMKSDEELVGLAKRIIDESGMSWREDLRKADTRLYCVLTSRGLLDSLPVVSKVRDWKSRNDRRVLTYARKVIRILGTRNITELEQADFGLGRELRKRKLVGSAFKQFGREKEAQGLVEISDAMEEFAKTAWPPG